MEWISVKDRLPTIDDTYNENQQILVWITGFDNKYGGVIGGCPYYEISNPDYASDYSDGITHWMKMPKPPERSK